MTEIEQQGKGNNNIMLAFPLLYQRTNKKIIEAVINYALIHQFFECVFLRHIYEVGTR